MSGDRSASPEHLHSTRSHFVPLPRQLYVQAYAPRRKQLGSPAKFFAQSSSVHFSLSNFYFLLSLFCFGLGFRFRSPFGHWSFGQLSRGPVVLWSIGHLVLLSLPLSAFPISAFYFGFGFQYFSVSVFHIVFQCFTLQPLPASPHCPAATGKPEAFHPQSAARRTVRRPKPAHARRWTGDRRRKI